MSLMGRGELSLTQFVITLSSWVAFLLLIPWMIAVGATEERIRDCHFRGERSMGHRYPCGNK